METGIKMALRIAAVVALIASLGSLIAVIIGHFVTSSDFLSTNLTSLLPYLKKGRYLCDMLIGNKVLSGIALYTTLSLPIVYFLATLAVRVYRLFYQ